MVVDDDDVAVPGAAGHLANARGFAGIQHDHQVRPGLLGRLQHANGAIEQEAETVREGRGVDDDGLGAAPGEPCGEGDLGAGAVAIRVDVGGQQRPV
ncbi:MAG: hypothetical protein P8174_10400 [Gemmatimonadota bacterium]